MPLSMLRKTFRLVSFGLAGLLLPGAMQTAAQDPNPAYTWITNPELVDLSADYDIHLDDAVDAWEIVPKSNYSGRFQQDGLNAIVIEHTIALDDLCSPTDLGHTVPVLSFGDATPEGFLRILPADPLRRRNFDLSFNYNVVSDMGGKRPGLFVLSTRTTPLVRNVETTLTFDHPLLSIVNLTNAESFCHTTPPKDLPLMIVRMIYHGTNTWLEVRPNLHDENHGIVPTYTAPIYLGAGPSIMHYFTHANSGRKDEDVRLLAHIGPLDNVVFPPKIYGTWFLRPPVEDSNFVYSGEARNVLDQINAYGSGIRTDFGPIESWDTQPYTNNWEQRYQPRYLADVDGDGKDDLVMFVQNSGVWVKRSGGTKFLHETKLSTQFGLNVPPIPPITSKWPDTAQAPRFMGDFDGDKKADIIGFDTAGIVVQLTDPKPHTETLRSPGPPSRWSNQFGYNPGSSNTFLDNVVNPRLIGDFDGDGMDDVLGVSNEVLYVAISEGDKFGPAYQVGTDFTPKNAWYDNDNQPRFAADVDGDGKDDLIGFNADGIEVGLNVTKEGKVSFLFGFWSDEMSTIDETGTYLKPQTLYPRQVIDVNKDGRADAVMFDEDGIRIALSTGRSFGPAYKINGIPRSRYTMADKWKDQNFFPRFFADVRGYGFPAIVGLRADDAVEVARQR